MKITRVEPMILYAQDEGMKREKNVGGYTGYQVIVRVDDFEIKNGKIRVPKEPGLGVEISEKALAKVRVR